MDAHKIAKNLVELRGTESQESIARKLGISTSAYVKYERGARIPRDEIKVKIAKYFNTSVESIFYA